MRHLAAVVATTSVVLWLAHVYAHALAESVSEEQLMRACRLVDVGRREATIASRPSPSRSGRSRRARRPEGLDGPVLAVWLGVGTLRQGSATPGSSSRAAWRRSPSSGRTSRLGS